jgi:hypothetical protein
MPRQLAAATTALLAATVVAGASDAALEKRIYEEGLLPSGSPVRAVLSGGSVLEGSQAACANCHRRSGMGALEGGTLVPPVTARALFQEHQPRRSDLAGHLFEEAQPLRTRAQIRSAYLRPPYTDASVSRALREGIASDGHHLGSAMPRYLLDDATALHLVAYLNRLGVGPAPGVDETTLHFSIVVADRVDAGARDAMLAVIEAFARRRNSAVEFESRKGERVAWDRREGRAGQRAWKYEIWKLAGPPEGWPQQLLAYQRKRPVFAMVSGMATPWRPVADFCEQSGTPCLFPETNLPVRSGAGHYTVYLSRGLEVEAAALAVYLQEPRFRNKLHRIVQVYRKSEAGLTASHTFRQGLYAIPIHDVPLDGQPLTSAEWASLLREEHPDALILWLTGEDLARFEIPQGATGPVVYISYTQVGQGGLSRLNTISTAIRMTFPFAQEGDRAPEAAHVCNWLNSTGIRDVRHERLQLSTYFTLSLLDYSLAKMAGAYSAEFLLETLEREVETWAYPGVFPRLSLGPEQRYASKGSYIVKLSGDSIAPLSSWIVP